MFKDLRDVNRAGEQAIKDQGGMFKMAKNGLADRSQPMIAPVG
jgi:hypothetical protein